MSHATDAIQHPRPDVDGSPRTATRTTAASDLTRPELASDTLRACLLRERSSPGRDEPRTSAARSERSGDRARPCKGAPRSEEHTSELQSLMRRSNAVFCLKKIKNHTTERTSTR